jgi:hypothetical protein
MGTTQASEDSLLYRRTESEESQIAMASYPSLCLPVASPPDSRRHIAEEN